VPGVDRTRRHLTSRPPGYRVPDLCNHPRSSAPGLLHLPWSSSLHTMPHLPPAHHETSKRDSPNETKVKEKQNKTIPNSNSNLAKSMTHHNQTKELTTWFLIINDYRSIKFFGELQLARTDLDDIVGSSPFNLTFGHDLLFIDWIDLLLTRGRINSVVCQKLQPFENRLARCPLAPRSHWHHRRIVYPDLPEDKSTRSFVGNSNLLKTSWQGAPLPQGVIGIIGG
jgi:hypothetical protein